MKILWSALLHRATIKISQRDYYYNVLYCSEIVSLQTRDMAVANTSRVSASGQVL